MRPHLGLASSILAAMTAMVIVLTSRGGHRENAGLATRAPFDLGVVDGFVENLGQWQSTVAFAATQADEWLHVCHDGLRFGRGKACFGLQPTQSSTDSRTRAKRTPQGLTDTGAVCNFLLGNDPSRHHLGARVFAAATLPEIGRGVDLVARRATPDSNTGAPRARFAYDLLVDSGADIAALEFRVLGSVALEIDASTGELVMRSLHGELRQSAPIAWTEADGHRAPIDCRFELRGTDAYGFAVAGQEGPATLCVDPDLQWATCFGGSARDNGQGLATAPNGDVFVGGTTMSPDLPTTFVTFDPSYNGSWPTPRDIGDCFVARLAATDGALLWCTYIGGGENDAFIELGSVDDDCILGGWTTSTDYPTTPGAFDTSHNGTGDGYLYLGGDVMVTRVAADGRSLVWSTFLGGSQLEYPRSMTVTAAGEVAVSGHVHSPDYPTTPGAYSDTSIGHSDFFVSRIAADGSSLIGSTYCGGSDGEEYPFGIAIAPDGDVIVAGGTNSTDLPVSANAFDPTYNGGTNHTADGFAMRFDSTLSNLRWCTYLGSPSNEQVRGMALHEDGSITIAGITDGPGLPTTSNVIAPNHLGGIDAYLWRISGDGSTSHWVTYFGGALDDRFERLLPMGGGRVAAVGRSGSTSLPFTRGSAGPASIGSEDALLAIIAADGQNVDYLAALGSPASDRAEAVARTPDGNLVTTGTFHWSGFTPTPGGRSYAGGGDAFVFQLAALPQGADRFGEPSGACDRGARIHTRSAPFVGDQDFALTCGSIPAGSPTLAAVSFAGLSTPVALPGADLWVDPALMLASIGVPADSWSTATLPLALPNDPGFAGMPLFAQFLWLDACPATVLGASDAIAITIQP